MIRVTRSRCTVAPITARERGPPAEENLSHYLARSKPAAGP